MSTPAERARALRKRHQRERQAVVFGSLIAGLGVLGLGAAAIYTDVLPAPFLDRPFSTPTAADDAYSRPPAPCPPEETLPLAVSSITVNVLNSSTRTGIAGTTASELTTRGFVVAGTDNAAGDDIPLPSEIHFGEAGIAAAYTLVGQLADPVLVLDTREDETVDLLLGSTFPGLVDEGSVALTPGVALIGVAGCVSIEDAVKKAIPGPTPEPTETPAADEATDAG